MTTTQAQNWVTVKDAAQTTGYNVEYVRQLARSGTISARHAERKILVNKDEILALRTKNGSLSWSATVESPKPELLELFSGDAEAALRAQHYLTDSDERMRRHRIVIDQLDALANGTADETREQRETLALLQHALNADRSSFREPYPASPT